MSNSVKHSTRSSLTPRNPPVTKESENVSAPQNRELGAQWFKLISIDEVKQGASRIKYAEKACFIVRDQQSFQVYDSICPHKTVNIPEDAINGMILECPMHLWKFSLETGECLEKGTQTPLKKLEHKVADGFLYLLL